MLPIRRAALRALSARPIPSSHLLIPARSFVTRGPQTSRVQSQWILSKFQRRFASDEAKSEESIADEPSEAEQKAAAELASTAADAPAESADAVTDAVISSRQPNDGPVVSEAVADSEDAVQSATTSFAPQATFTTDAEVGAAAAAAAGQQMAYDRSRRPMGATFGVPEHLIPTNRMLYIGNMFFETTEQDLQSLFGDLGEIENVRIVRDPRGLSKGFGYVTFKNLDDATRAIELRNQEIFHGRRITVQYHRPRENAAPRVQRDNRPSKTLFIGNMSFEMSDKDLNDLFREVRNVLDVRVAIDRRSGQPRGFAHADFIDVASATKAKEILADKEIYGRKLRVDYTNSNANMGSGTGPQ